MPLTRLTRVPRLLEALSPFSNRVVGVVWCLGDSDYRSGNQAQYPAAFRVLVREFRQQLSAPVLPVAIMGLNPNAISANATSMIALQDSLGQGGANGITGAVYSCWSPDWGDGTKTAPAAMRIQFILGLTPTAFAVFRLRLICSADFQDNRAA